jgi:hypothetical protein
MAHLRKSIRDAVVTILTGLTTTGARVYPSRLYPYDPAEAGGPGLMVYTVSESSELEGRTLTRELDLVIEVVAQVNDTLDDTLDTIAVEIETAMGTDPRLGFTGPVDSWLKSTQFAFRKDGEKETGGLVMTYGVYYRTTQANPEALN